VTWVRTSDYGLLRMALICRNTPNLLRRSAVISWKYVIAVGGLFVLSVSKIDKNQVLLSVRVFEFTFTIIIITS
jgi:hypothetical protein